MGDREFGKRLAEVFLNDSYNRIKNLEDALLNRDAKTSRREAHTLKSSSANVGGEIFSNLAKQIEKKCSDNDLDSAIELLPELKNQMEKLKLSLTRAFL